MNLLQPFDARQFDPTQNGSTGFPIGTHNVVVVKSEVKPTKDGNSGMAVLEAMITDGEYKGATGPIRFNLYSTSQQAVEIAHKQFSALCHCVGVFNVTNTQQLHNIPFKIEVGLQKEPNDKKYTEVKRFFDSNGNEPGQTGNNQGQQQQQNNSGFGQQGNQGQQGNNGGQQQNNGGGFGQQNNGQQDNGQQQTQNNGGFGQQGQQGQQQNNGGAGTNWSQNVGTNGNNGANNGGNGGNGGGTPAAGGWGQQRS